MFDSHIGQQGMPLSRFTITDQCFRSGKSECTTAHYRSKLGMFLHCKFIKGGFYAAQIQAFNPDTLPWDSRNNLIFYKNMAVDGGHIRHEKPSRSMFELFTTLKLDTIFHASRG